MSRKLYSSSFLIGPQFDTHQDNVEGNAQSYADTLRFYRPRGFSKLARELESAANGGKALEFVSEIEDEADSLLTEFAQRATRNPYIYFGISEQGDAGFWINVESAIEDANHIIDDSSRGRNDGDIPRNFTGLYVHISDHGNVSAYVYSRGKSRELFAVV